MGVSSFLLKLKIQRNFFFALPSSPVITIFLISAWLENWMISLHFISFLDLGVVSLHQVYIDHLDYFVLVDENQSTDPKLYSIANYMFQKKKGSSGVTSNVYIRPYLTGFFLRRLHKGTQTRCREEKATEHWALFLPWIRHRHVEWALNLLLRLTLHCIAIVSLSHSHRSCLSGLCSNQVFGLECHKCWIFIALH